MMSFFDSNHIKHVRSGLVYPWFRLLVGMVIMVLIAVLASGVGTVDIPPSVALKILASKLPWINIQTDWPSAFETILLQLRMPRVTLACIAGASLAISGASYQGLFRNPLADPYLIGAAPGAGLGATIVLATNVPMHYHGVSLLPLAAFIGALGAVSLAYAIAHNSEGLPLTTLILAGVAIASISTAFSALILIRSEPDLRPVLSWLMGGFILSQWKHSLMMLPYLIPSVLTMLAYGRLLNVMQLDEVHAKQLGVSVENVKVILIIAASLSTATVVAFSGLIGFVGLIVPHSVRLIWGVDYRIILPMSAIAGGGFLILADLVARTIVIPSELPVGIITAFCGAPFFLYILRYRRYVSM